MNYSPKQENRHVSTIVISLIATGIIVYLLPNFAEIRAVFCQIPAMIFLVAAVFFLVRYQTTSFIYTIRLRSRLHDNTETDAALAEASHDITRVDPKYLDFIVSKKQGSRDANMECVLGLSDLIEAWEISPESEHQKISAAMTKARAEYGTVDLYDYTVTLGLKNSLLLLFRDGEKHAAIRIEPDVAWQSYLKRIAEGSKSE